MNIHRAYEMTCTVGAERVKPTLTILTVQFYLITCRSDYTAFLFLSLSYQRNIHIDRCVLYDLVLRCRYWIISIKIKLCKYNALFFLPLLYRLRNKTSWNFSVGKLDHLRSTTPEKKPDILAELLSVISITYILDMCASCDMWEWQESKLVICLPTPHWVIGVIPVVIDT